MAPDHIDLVYRKVGDYHIFASKGIKGLVHVGHQDLNEACTRVLTALNCHVEQTYGVEAHYVCESGFAELSRKIASGGECEFVQAVLEPIAA